MSRRWPPLLIGAALFLVAWQAAAEDMIMRRIPLSFPETMSALQSAVVAQGYRVTRVQRVDIGLTSSGYDTAEYRIVFFAREQEMQDLVGEHPQLVPFLPLKITIFAERSDTLLVTINPMTLAGFFPETGLDALFSRWERDVSAILDRVQAEPD